MTKQYTITLKHGDQLYKSKGADIVAALDGLSLNGYVKCRSTLLIAFGKLKAEVNLYPRMLKKLLINKTSKELFQKRMLGALR